MMVCQRRLLSVVLLHLVAFLTAAPALNAASQQPLDELEKAMVTAGEVIVAALVCGIPSERVARLRLRIDDATGFEADTQRLRNILDAASIGSAESARRGSGGCAGIQVAVEEVERAFRGSPSDEEPIRLLR